MEFSCKVPNSGFLKSSVEQYIAFQVFEKCIKYIVRDYLFHPVIPAGAVGKSKPAQLASQRQREPGATSGPSHEAVAEGRGMAEVFKVTDERDGWSMNTRGRSRFSTGL